MPRKHGATSCADGSHKRKMALLNDITDSPADKRPVSKKTPRSVDHESNTPMEVEGETDVVFNSQGIPEYQPIEIPPAPEKVATYAADGPRLMISHIVNENFKSYAGVKTLGTFHKSFTSIVGPNGSGKSNVIDSMLFVFGYRANKIRSKKISVLIHSSTKHQNINSCTVAVHFQKIKDTGPGDDDYEVIEGSKFSVSRTAFRDNSSYYRINDKKATYKEVAVLLRSSGIDLDHNRFLILQGEVEQIAMMKPKALTEHDEGMLEFLEDIIGSSRFKEPIQMLVKRVEDLNEFRTEKLNRVKVAEKDKDDLEGPKNEAIEYLTIENEISKKKHVQYQKYIQDCNRNVEETTIKRDEIKDEMKGVMEELEELANEKKIQTKGYKDVTKNLEKLVKNTNEKKDEFSAFEQQDVRCREDLKHCNSKDKKLIKSLQQEKLKLEDMNLLPEKYEKDIESYVKKLEKLEKEKEEEEDKLKEVMESLKTETQDIQDTKEEKEKELLELQKDVNETKSKMNVGQTELDLYGSRLQNEQNKLKKTVDNLERATNTLKEKQRNLKELEKRLPEAEELIITSKEKLETLTTKEEQYTNVVRDLRVKISEARSAMQSNRSRGRVLEALMEQKNSGKIPGILGRLGDLGGIAKQYDVAISTACGPLDNIVVDTINTGQKCVEFLKRSGVGSATFIGLDKMERWRGQCNKKITTPENVPRLFDLIKVSDSRVSTAFYYAIRDTLVAKDLDQATRIAYGRQRYRVVTVNGQLIDQSGTMSGGGGAVSRGRMGTSAVEEKVDPKQIQEWEKVLEKETKESQNCRDVRARTLETVTRTQKEVHDVQHALQKCSVDIKNLTEQEAALKVQKSEQELAVKNAAPDQKELKTLETKVNQATKEYQIAKEKASKVEDEVHSLHKQIMDIGGTKLKSAEYKVNQVNTKIDQVVGLQTKAKVSIKTAKRNMKKIEDKVQSMEDDYQENKEKLIKLNEELKQLEEDANKVLEAYNAAQEEMGIVEKELQVLKEKLVSIEEKEQTINKSNIEIRHQLEKIEGIVKEHQAKLKHWSKQLNKISLHKIDGDESLIELPMHDNEYLEDLDDNAIEYEITVLEEKIKNMKPNMSAIAEFKEKEDLYLRRVSELDKITELRDSQRTLHGDLRKQRLDEFAAGFSIITNKLKEMYQMITLGGDAELELVDSLDPFSEGIVFSVRPPKKSWKNISNLSGGEKTLSSLALVFALHHYKPTPLYVMDEIDAALDFKNVSIVANYIKERTKNAQFIIISLRNNMFELADLLIGIYKTYDCTNTVAINPTKMCMPLKEVDTNSGTTVS